MRDMLEKETDSEQGKEDEVLDSDDEDQRRVSSVVFGVRVKSSKATDCLRNGRTLGSSNEFSHIFRDT